MANVTMVRSRVKPENAAQVESAVKTMFAAIQSAHPSGVRYASTMLPDGVTYVALLQLDEGVDNPLPRMAEFRAFQERVQGWMAEPPTMEQLQVVGSYGLFG